MTAPYPASLAMVSSGQLLFADASQSWNPSQFPVLPAVNIALTAQGTAASGNVSTLTLTNSNIYEPFEPPSIRPDLSKQFQISQGGLVTFEESKVGFVSTVATSFNAGVSNLQQSAIGGAGIQDIVTGTPDTMTNAVAKLDAWLANAFLFQPPAVQTVAAETNSMWGGIRWQNFNTYNVLDKFIPYVTSIVLIIGDVTTSDYCTLEITNPSFYPYKTYTSGISPQQTPLVDVRVFSDFFPGGNTTYTKRALEANCIRVVTESGAAIFPTSGPVAAVDPTNGVDSYTILSLYLPLMETAYPKGTPIPINIVYLNNTSAPTHITTTSVTQTTTGGPSAFSSITVVGAGTGFVDLQVPYPQYSDVLTSTTESYFSSYTVSYTYDQLAIANVANVGFQYGVPNPTTTPSSLSTYVGNTYSESYPVCSSVQNILVEGNPPVVPGAVWSTSVLAYNSAFQPGVDTAGPYASTLFPMVTISSIQSTLLEATDLTQVALASTLHSTLYNGTTWSVGPSIGNDVLFISTVGPLEFGTQHPVQFNDPTYPGDQNTNTFILTQTDLQTHSGQPVSLSLTPVNNNYVLNSVFSQASNAAILATTLSDTQSTFGYQQFFYAARLLASVTVSTLSTATQSVQLSQLNTRIPSFNGTPQVQLQNSPPYVFSTEYSGQPSTTGAWITAVTSTIFISGLLTPTPNSQFCFDMSGTNFASMYSAATFAEAQLYYKSNAAGPFSAFSTNVRIMDGLTPVTTRPFPANTVLTLSSLSVNANESVYTDPNDPGNLFLVATVTPANPTSNSSITISTLVYEYVDTLSYPYLSNFTDQAGTNGQRVLCLVPYINDTSTSQYFMDDGIDTVGSNGQGLNTDVSSFITVTLPNQVALLSSLLYNNTSSISSIYTDYYSRELLFSGGHYIHPAGFNFTPFNDGFQYPDFTYDLYNDTTFGNRYATFAFEQSTLTVPTPYSYLYVRVNTPSLLSSIQMTRTENNWWPNTLTNELLVSSMKVRMHTKLTGTYNAGTTRSFETAWLNALKQVDLYAYDDSIYDIGSVYGVSTLSGGDVEYQVQINRRSYLKVMALVRVGIALDASQYSGTPITFTGIQVRMSDS